MDECLKILEVSPDAASSDEIFCQWIRLQHIADDVGTQFSIEDPAACAGLDDSKMRFAIKGLEGQLRACTAYPLKVQKPGNKSYVNSAYHIVLTICSDFETWRACY